MGTAGASNPQDCGRPYYVEDYNAFYAAIKAVYPDMVLIANCPMGAAAPTDLWDWHSYDASWTMFNRMHEFDNLRRGQDSPVFVSEYAVTADGGWGNLRVRSVSWCCACRGDCCAFTLYLIQIDFEAEGCLHEDRPCSSEIGMIATSIPSTCVSAAPEPTLPHRMHAYKDWVPSSVQAAVSEASFMTGMERNSDIIKLASYAPLFVHTENRIWPTNMIVIDNHRCKESRQPQQVSCMCHHTAPHLHHASL